MLHVAWRSDLLRGGVLAAEDSLSCPSGVPLPRTTTNVGTILVVALHLVLVLRLRLGAGWIDFFYGRNMATKSFSRPWQQRMAINLSSHAALS